MITKFKKKKRSRGFKEATFSILITMLFLGLIIFLVFTNVKISQKRSRLISRIENLKQEIKVLEDKNTKLKENLLKAGSKEHLERIAREELGMKKSGEEVVVITREKKEEKKKEEKQDRNFWNPKYWWRWLSGRD